MWLYAEHGEIVSKGAVGFRDTENKSFLLEDSIFDIASVSKQFTATAVMLLRRRGLLNLDEEVSKFFPEIKYEGITIRRLLNHTSGLDDYDDEMRAIWETEGRIPDNSAIIRILAESKPKLLFAPGEQLIQFRLLAACGDHLESSGRKVRGFHEKRSIRTCRAYAYARHTPDQDRGAYR